MNMNFSDSKEHSATDVGESITSGAIDLCDGFEEFEMEREFSRLEHALNQQSMTPEHVINLAATILAKIDQGRKFILPWLDAASKDCGYLPPVRSYTKETISGLVLFSHEKLQITLNCMDNNLLASNKLSEEIPESIVFSGRKTISRFVISGGSNLEIWKCNGLETCLETTARCWNTGTKYISDGDVLIQDGAYESFVIDKASNCIVFLQAVVITEDVSRVREFDGLTGKQLAQSSESLKSSQIQMYSTLLRLFQRTDSYDLLESYLAHEDENVRWHIMRELVALDTQSSLKPLKIMLEADDSLLIRKAAEQTLNMIEEQLASSA